MKAHAVDVQASRLQGTLRVPPSKSETHRAFLLAAQSDLPCTVRNPLHSDDTQATLANLHALGARLHLQDDGVQFLPAPLHAPRTVLDCRNSGTTLRLLTALAARLGQPVTLTGDDSLRRRPNQPLLDALTQLGAHCTSDGGRAPLTVRGPLRGGVLHLPPGTSSQYASALLLALSAAPGDSVLHLAAPVASAPYLAVTLAWADQFGLRTTVHEEAGLRIDVPGRQQPRAATCTVAGDWSTAAFPLAAAALTGDIIVTGLDPTSPQGDRAILDHLRSFGAKVQVTPDGARVTADSLASPGTIDVAATPDLFPILAVLAAASRGQTTFTGGASLRHKESDRIATMAAGLRQLGVAIEERPDGMTVTGGPLHGATVASQDDHRIHMAFAIAGLVAPGTTRIDGAASAAVSFPSFHADFVRLGARFTLRQGNREVVA